MIKSCCIAMLPGSLLLSLYAMADQSQAPTALPTYPPEHVLLGAHSLTLENQDNRCVLVKADQSVLPLDMKWPCRFSEDQQNKVRIEDYREALIVMVERSEPLPAPSKNCKTDRQPVRLYKGKLEAAPVGQVATCGPAHWDQKAFIAFFDWSER